MSFVRLVLRLRSWALLISTLALSTGVVAQIPAGTVLPAMLENSINTKKSKPGQRVLAILMQDVPLPDKLRIPSGTKVLGRVVEVSQATKEHGARVSFLFDHLLMHALDIAITTDLRALASTMEVNDAYVPLSGAHQGLAARNWRTRLVGGTVGYSAYGGDLSGLAPGPGSACEANPRPQALWVFSSIACGTYGFRKTRIADVGRTMTGEIVLISESGNINVRSGSGLLLRIISMRR